MKKALLWLWLLTKRLYKKPAFLAILVLIPALVLSYGASARQGSGMMTVALAQEGNDPLAQKVLEDLQGSSQVIYYRVCDSAAQAQLLVASGKADAAWILPDDLDEKICAFMDHPHESNAFIRVVQREETVAQKLSRERLGGAVYHELAQRFYLRFIRENFPDMTATDQELLTPYNEFQMDGSLFIYESTAGKAAEDTHYLLSPVRGVLGVLAVLCGMAAAMYQVKDRQEGTFGWLPRGKQPLWELGCQLVAVGNVTLVSLLALLLTGMAGQIFMELAVLALYSVAVAVFCMLLRSALGSIRALGGAIPLLLIAMLLVCPVFVVLRQLRLVSLLLPPTYYINAIHNPAYLGYMGLYILVCGGLYLLSEKLHKRI